MKGRLLKYYCVFFLIVCSSRSFGQTPALFTFDTKSKYTSGYNFTVTDQFSYYVALSLGGNLNVRAAGDLINGAYSIPVSSINLQVSSVRTSFLTLDLTNAKPVVTLSTNNTVFYSGLSVSLLTTLYFSFNYSTAGGTTFLNKPAGTYSTTLTFLSGPSTVMATATLSVVINDVGEIAAVGASNASLAFATAQEYINGVSLTQSNALNVFSNQPYLVNVKTSGVNLQNGANTIAVSNIHVQATPNPTVAGITTPGISFTNTGQVIINAAGAGLGTLSQNFDLRYYTDAMNSAFINKPAGTYTTTLTYTVTAP